jgi:hypothetical protein
MNKLKKKHMTKFDYNIRIFSVISGILFVAALAFVSPLLDNVNASLEKTSDAIKIQTLQNNYAKYDDNIELVNND